MKSKKKFTCCNQPTSLIACGTGWQCLYVHETQAAYNTVANPQVIALPECAKKVPMVLVLAMNKSAYSTAM